MMHIDLRDDDDEDKICEHAKNGECDGDGDCENCTWGEDDVELTLPMHKCRGFLLPKAKSISGIADVQACGVPSPLLHQC